MALIKCTKCGGNVSDSANVCPHCGYKFLEEVKEFTRLPKGKQKALRKEYDEIYPGYLKAEEKDKKIHTALYVIIPILLISGLCWGSSILARNFNASGIWTVIELISAFVSILNVIIMVILFSRKKKIAGVLLKELKKFQAWLVKEKDLSFNVALSQKERNIFEKIKI